MAENESSTAQPILKYKNVSKSKRTYNETFKRWEIQTCVELEHNFDQFANLLDLQEQVSDSYFKIIQKEINLRNSSDNDRNSVYVHSDQLIQGRNYIRQKQTKFVTLKEDVIFARLRFCPKTPIFVK